MCRAKETAKIISGHLPNVTVQTCDLLQEGAPFPPEPPVGHWKPEFHVTLARCCSSSSRSPNLVSNSSFTETEPVSRPPSAGTSTVPMSRRRRTALRFWSVTPMLSAISSAGKFSASPNTDVWCEKRPCHMTGPCNFRLRPGCGWACTTRQSPGSPFAPVAAWRCGRWVTAATSRQISSRRRDRVKKKDNQWGRNKTTAVIHQRDPPLHRVCYRGDTIDDDFSWESNSNTIFQCDWNRQMFSLCSVFSWPSQSVDCLWKASSITAWTDIASLLNRETRRWLYLKNIFPGTSLMIYQVLTNRFYNRSFLIPSHTISRKNSYLLLNLQ